MRSTLGKLPGTLALLTLALLATASGPAQAKEKRVPIEKFKARAMSLDRGKVANLDIVIYEWTTPEERAALLQTFVEKGSKELYNALGKEKVKGYVRAPQSLGYDMMYAWAVDLEDGKRRIVLAADRPLAFVEIMRSTRSVDYNVSLLVLEIDPETGEGEGSATVGAELSIDKENRLLIEYGGTQPTRLVKVKRQKIKK